MMLGAGTRVGLFLSSYLPLFLIAALINWSTNRWLSIAALIVAALGALSLSVLLLWPRGVATVPMKIARVQNKDAEALAYIVSYIFPFIDIDFGDELKAASLGVLFLTLGVIYVSGHMIHVNPMLNLLRWHVYEIETPAGTTQTLIARGRRPRAGQEVHVVSIADDIHMVRSYGTAGSLP